MAQLLWPEGAPLTNGVSDEDCPALTPYLVEGTGKAAVIVSPGGAYSMRAAHEAEPIAQWLHGLGISAFVLRYRVAPYSYPCALLIVHRPSYGTHQKTLSLLKIVFISQEH